jgi:hypothetical protein
MYGIMYSVDFDFTHVTTASDCVNLSPAANDFVVLHSVRISQTDLEGDSNAAMMDVVIARVAGDGSGGTADAAALPHMEGAPTKTTTVRTGDTTAAGSQSVIIADAWNVQAGWLYIPTPEERIVVSATSNLVVSLGVPDASTAIVGTVTFEEILA